MAKVRLKSVILSRFLGVSRKTRRERNLKSVGVAGASALKMVASRNGREGLELNASEDGGRILTPARLETRRGRLKWSRCGFRLEMGRSRCARTCLEMWGVPPLMSIIVEFKISVSL
eukprot:6220068-Prymnesium_polylepis.1